MRLYSPSEEAGAILDRSFREIVDTTPDAILLVDAEGLIVYANHAAETLFGYLPADLLRQPLASLLPERVRERHREHFRRFLGRSAAAADARRTWG